MEMKKEINKNLNLITIGSILLDVIFIALGIFLVINPELSTKVSGVLIGIGLIVVGLYAVIKYVLNMDTIAFIFTFELIFGILSIITGILLMANPLAIASFITIIIGVWFIISAVIKGSIALRFKRYNEETWILNSVISILTVILGILLLTNPFSAYIVLSTYVGIMIIVYSSMDIVEQLLFRKRAANIEKILFK